MPREWTSGKEVCLGRHVLWPRTSATRLHKSLVSPPGASHLSALLLGPTAAATARSIEAYMHVVRPGAERTDVDSPD